MSETRRMGRPPKTSADQILDAAALMDPNRLQLTTVAAELGISVKTVQRYFPTRKALFDALTAREVEAMGPLTLEHCVSWREVITEIAVWSYNVGRNSPGWFFDSAGLRGVGVELTRVTHRRLTQLGWSTVDALQAAAATTSWAIATGEAARRTTDLGGLSVQAVGRALDDYSEGAELEQLVQGFASLSLSNVFDVGLAIMLAGISDTIPSAV